MPEDSTAPPLSLHSPREAYDWSRISPELDQAKLRPTEFRIYCYLLTKADKTHVAWPGIRSMADQCDINKETACIAIKSLCELGFITLTKTIAGSVYRVEPKLSWTVRKIRKSQGVRKIRTVRKEGTSQEKEKMACTENPDTSVRKGGTCQGVTQNGTVPKQVPPSPLSPPHTPPHIFSSPKKELTTLAAESSKERLPESEPKDWQTFQAYCLKKGCSSDEARYFYATWKGNGWRINGQTIADWRYKVVSWHTAGYGSHEKRS